MTPRGLAVPHGHLPGASFAEQPRDFGRDVGIIRVLAPRVVVLAIGVVPARCAGRHPRASGAESRQGRASLRKGRGALTGPRDALRRTTGARSRTHRDRAASREACRRPHRLERRADAPRSVVRRVVSRSRRPRAGFRLGRASRTTDAARRATRFGETIFGPSRVAIAAVPSRTMRASEKKAELPLPSLPPLLDVRAPVPSRPRRLVQDAQHVLLHAWVVQVARLDGGGAHAGHH